MIIYYHDSNGILTTPLKTKSAMEQLQAIKEAYLYLNQRGIEPKIHILDNECPNSVKDYIKNTLKIEVLIVPPYIHHVNADKKEIDVFKCHFITGLATVDPKFLLHL